MGGAACGKVILLGEHAVVYGVPALVAGIDRGARATARRRPSGRSELRLAGSAGVHDDSPTELGRAFAALLAVAGVDHAVEVDAGADLPAAAGLGCSAALGVAIARALDEEMGREPASPGGVAAAAMAWETVFHGNPSGIDAAAAARGGCFAYTRADGRAHIEPIQLAEPLSLVVGHTGVASSTRVMVEGVARMRERRPEVVAKAFDGIASLVGNARLALEAGDIVGLGRLMDLCQMILSGLMLSTEEIETLCRLAREAGALGAKLTGAGGGGCVVALAGESPAPILEAWRAAGFEAFSTVVAASGAAASHAGAP